MEGSITLTMKEQRKNDIIVKLINKEISINQTYSVNIPYPLYSMDTTCQKCFLCHFSYL